MPSSWFRTIEIDRGSADGVIEGLPVIDAAGLVGRVVRSAPHSARVLLITDASSAVAVLVQDQRIRGVCRGQGGALALDFALLEDAIQVGDGVITSGLGGVFPKGLVVGYVRSVQREQFGLFQTVDVEPAVDFAHLEEVLVHARGGAPMRLLAYLGLAVLALLLQTVLLPPLLPGEVKPDLVLLLTIWIGLRESPWQGGALVYAIGWLYDGYAGTYPGLHGFVLLAVFLVVCGMATRLNTESLPLLWYLVGGGTLLQVTLLVFAVEFFASAQISGC